MIPIVSLMLLRKEERCFEFLPICEMRYATVMINRKKSHLRMGFYRIIRETQVLVKLAFLHPIDMQIRE
jgi:IS1 family transposase